MARRIPSVSAPDWCGPLRSSLAAASVPPWIYLYIVKIPIQSAKAAVKRNLYSVKMAAYKTKMTRKPTVTRARTRSAATNVAPARSTRKRSASQPSAANEAAPYHHGALHGALLEAAERVLERDGLAGLTLRAVAREAGVSHAAPTHHFGDLTGLVSELAAIGFQQFNAAMATVNAADASPIEQ